MADSIKTIQFDDHNSKLRPICTACEDMLADALDETLSNADQKWFDAHLAGCIVCNQMVADAQRGAAWLELLKSPRPEPSAALMERILAQTSGRAGLDAMDTASVAGVPVIPGQPALMPAPFPSTMIPAGSQPSGKSNLLVFQPKKPRFASWSHVMFEPRLAMTAAMAFFSVALTLNLTGVRLDQIHAKDLNPTHLKQTYYAANAEAVRYYDNLRVVRVVESKVDDLREANQDSGWRRAPESQPEAQPAPKDDQKPAEQKKPAAGPGASLQNIPMGQPERQLTDDKMQRSATPVANHKSKTQEGGLG